MTYKKRDFVPLSVTHPELAVEACGWDPTTLRPGSNKKVTWECSLGHRWDAAPNARTGQRQGCAVCAGKKVLIGFNDLLTTRPDVAKEADGWDPRTVTQASGKRMAWECKKGHKWLASVASRSKGSSCPVCAGKAVEAGFNDLATTHPDLAKQAHGWDPRTVNFGSDKVREWICSIGHVWTASVMTRSKGNGCSICANKKVLAGYNDLATTHPELAKEAFGWNPTTIIGGSHKKLEWKCSFGHVWDALANSRTSMDSGCPTCSITGFDPNKDGWLYFLEHPDWEMQQIGITNVPDDRLATHKRLGWIVVELRGPMKGDLTRQWETDILRMLRAKKAVVGDTAIAGKFTGYTESWLEKSFSVKSLRELMQMVREFEDFKRAKK
jgi:hypothetical protein